MSSLPGVNSEICYGNMMKRIGYIIIAATLLLSACSNDDQFVAWQTETFDKTPVTESVTKTFVLGNSSDDKEQHVRGIAFDRGSNGAGHFTIAGVKVGDRDVAMDDIVVPPGSALSVTVNYSPLNLETSIADYGGWVTGEEESWTPMHPDEVEDFQRESDEAIHRSMMVAVYDYPRDGIFYVQLVGQAEEGPNGERDAGGSSATCTPGSGTACYTGGFALDIPQLAPGGPKPLEITGPMKIGISGGAATMNMEDFPFVIYYLRSEEITQLPSGVTATLVLSGALGYEATGTFDGSRLTLEGVAFRIRVTLGELSVDDVRGGMSAMVDFDLTDLEITTISSLDQGAITLHMETIIPNNPSGNDIFDQFLSGIDVIAFMEGELAL